MLREYRREVSRRFGDENDGGGRQTGGNGSTSQGEVELCTVVVVCQQNCIKISHRILLFILGIMWYIYMGSIALAELSTHVINTLVASVTKPGNEQLVETRGSYDVFEQFIDIDMARINRLH